MINVKAAVVSSFASYLLGGAVFKDIKDIVNAYRDKDLTNEEKHALALKEIQEMGLDLASWAIDFGIKLVCIYLNVKVQPSLSIFNTK